MGTSSQAVRSATGGVKATRTGITHRRPAPSAVGAAVLLACYGVGLATVARRASLWGDEGFTAAMVRLPVRTIVGDLRHIDVNMGAYYLLVVPVERMLGDSELALRLVSITAVVATVPLFVRLVQPMVGRFAARAGAAMLALDPFTVTLAATARPYALLLLGVVATSLTLRRALRLSAAGTDRARDWLLWSGLCAGLLYVHLLAVLVIGAEVVYLAARRPRLHRRVLPAGLVLAASVIPTVLFIAPPDTLAWVGPATLHDAREAAISALGGRPVAATVLLLALIGAGGALARVVSRRGRGDPSRWPDQGLLLCLAFLPVAAMVALAPVQSLFVDLYCTPLLVPVFAVAGVGAAFLAAAVPGAVARISVRSRTTVGVLAVVAVLAVETLALHRGISGGSLAAPQQWRAVSAELDAEVRPGDLVGFPNVFFRIVGEYYAAHSPSARTGGGWRVGTPVLPTAAWGTRRPYELDRDKRLGLYDSEQALVDEIGAARTLWLVGPDDPLFRQARDRLLAQGWTATPRGSFRGVVVLRLTRGAAPG